jgi:hypothetical protein
VKGERKRMTKKIPIDLKLYRELEVQAKEKGLANVDDYVNDLVKQLVKTPIEEVKPSRYDPSKPLFPQLTQLLKEKNKE